MKREADELTLYVLGMAVFSTLRRALQYEYGGLAFSSAPLHSF